MAKAETTVKKQLDTTTKITLKSKKAFGLPNQFDSLIRYFQKAEETDEAWFQILDMFPIPIEIFSPDGTSVFSNRAWLELNNIRDASFITGKYNVLKDPVMEQIMAQMGLTDRFQRVFRGEADICNDFPAPIQDLVDRGIIEEKPYEKATMDIFNYPVWKNDKLHFIVCVFVVRSLYLGRPDVVRAKEYIDKHWQEEYDPKRIAKSVNMSVTPLYNLFKQHMGMTPGYYYKKVKVEHIKEKLADKNLSIKEAFAACGEDSRGRIARVFKEITGKSPKEFRLEL
jgi:AraC-like DNA-binding protein